MKINFSQALFDFRTGQKLTREVNGDAAEALTLGFCCSEALIMPSQDKNAEKKVSDLMLAMKVYAGEELEITPEEASRLKEKIAEAYPSAIVSGQCCQMLNG